MYAIGHLALGYMFARLVNKEKTLNIPLVWFLSMLPDIDFLIPQLKHRGQTHSLILHIIIFIPLFLMKGRKMIPYFLALTSHSVIGDYFTSYGVALFWPIDRRYFSFISTINTGTILESIIELILFSIMVITIILYKDNENSLYILKNIVPISFFIIVIQLISINYIYSIPHIILIPNILIIFIVTTSYSVLIIKKIITK